ELHLLPEDRKAVHLFEERAPIGMEDIVDARVQLLVLSLELDEFRAHAVDVPLGASFDKLLEFLIPVGAASYLFELSRVVAQFILKKRTSFGQLAPTDTQVVALL